MAEPTFNPPLPTKSQGSFSQRIMLSEGPDLLASVHWFTTGNDGVVQLLELSVSPAHQRTGHAGRLLAALEDQARRYWRLRRKPLRRIWIGVEQKSQVIGRAFLTQHGFHHIATASHLLADQDLLIYSKGMD